MLKNEKLVRYIVSNFVIIFVVGGIFTATLIGIPLTGVSAKNSPISKGGSKIAMSLMINVYGGTEYIQPMLDIFSQSDVAVTFFIGGLWAEKNENLLKEMYIAGHEIGSHGYLHKNHSKLTRQGNYQEIDITHKLIKSILNIDMDLFAPPSGDYSDTTLEVAAELGYKTIMWTKDTIDWRDKDSKKILERATGGMSGGNLILMHPTEKTVEALPEIISVVKKAGLSLDKVSSVL